MCAMALATAASLLAGGFVLQIGKPDANPEARAKHAVLVVRGFACAEQENTMVTGTAEGVVNGMRRTMALKLIPLSDQSTYAVIDQWPSEGKWVLAFTMTNPRFGQQSAVVKVESGAVAWAGISRFNHAATKEDIETALSTTAVAAR
jgi:hypothetical protein